MVRLQQQKYKTLHTNSKKQQPGSWAAAHSANSGDGSGQNAVVVAVRGHNHTDW